jgi:hypothetical protein
MAHVAPLIVILAHAGIHGNGPFLTGCSAVHGLAVLAYGSRFHENDKGEVR